MNSMDEVGAVVVGNLKSFHKTMLHSFLYGEQLTGNFAIDEQEK